jgi:hypothetical protein
MIDEKMIDKAIDLFKRLYRYGEEGLTIDANIAREIEEMIALLESAKAGQPELRYLGDEKHDASNCPVCNELSGKQAEQPPEPPKLGAGGFTKKWRDRLAQSECFMQLTGANEAEWMKAMREACDRLDAQQQEIERLIEERGHAQNGTHKVLVEVDRLTAENKELIVRDKFLTALENSGVDNWEGYDEAIETLNSEG